MAREKRDLTKATIGIEAGIPLEASKGGIDELRRDIQHLEKVPSAVRPELDKALTGDVTLQVALIPSADARRILEAFFPAGSGGGLPSGCCAPWLST